MLDVRGNVKLFLLYMAKTSEAFFLQYAGGSKSTQHPHVFLHSRCPMLNQNIENLV